MLGGVLPRHVVRVDVALLRECGIAVVVRRVVDILQAKSQQFVLRAAKRCREPVQNAQVLLGAFGRALFERRGPQMASGDEMLQLSSVARREQRQWTNFEWRRCSERRAPGVLPAVDWIAVNRELARDEVRAGNDVAGHGHRVWME